MNPHGSQPKDFSAALSLREFRAVTGGFFTPRADRRGDAVAFEQTRIGKRNYEARVESKRLACLDDLHAWMMRCSRKGKLQDVSRRL
jgi:hypothetical protein